MVRPGKAGRDVRFAVTGVGAVSSLSVGADSLWEAVCAGRSGARSLDWAQDKGLPVTFAAPVVDSFDATDYLTSSEVRRFDPFIHYGMAATVEAVEQSGLVASDNMDPEKCGVILSTGMGGNTTTSETMENYALSGGIYKRVSPFGIPGSIANMLAGMVSIRYGVHGGAFSAVSACASGLHAIGIGCRLIAYGDWDVAIVGGADAGLNIYTLVGFSRMSALSKRNEHPEKASRPFDSQRDGFVLAAGSATLVIERWEHAVARGAHILAEVAGFGQSADAYHVTHPDAEGAGAERAMHNALKDAGWHPDEIDYVNAHATSTPMGDVSEAKALRRILGKRASQVPISAPKSMTGHALGAAGALESVITIKSLASGRIHPTINLEDPDEEFAGLDLVPEGARDLKFNNAICNSFGFGGTNVCVALSAVE